MGFPPYTNHFVNAVHHLHNAQVLEQQMQATSVAMGTLDESQISSILALAMAFIKNQPASEKEKREQSTRDILQQALVQHIKNLARQIENLEAGFRDQHGDAWREHIANKILDADEIPQQRPGETIDEYRQRLEKRLVEEMLNPDGSIKDKYKDDPEYRKYAQWAQKIYHRDIAQAIANDLKNPATTHQQTYEILDRLEKARNSEVNLSTADQLDGHEAKQDAVLNVDDNNRDNAGLDDYSTFASSFGQPLTPV